MNKYWQNRFNELEKASLKKGIETYKQIENAFTKAQMEIEKEIEAWYGRFAKNNAVDMNEAKRLLNSKELKEFKWDVKEYIEKGRENALNQKWNKQLENASARFHINRLEALKIRIQQSAEVAFGNQLDEIDDMARSVFSENYYRSIFEVQKGFNIGFKIAEIDDRLLNKIISKPWALDGKNFSDRIWSNKDKLVNELHNELTQNVLLGNPPKDMINKISSKFNTSKSNASRLVMTELAFFHTASEMEAFKELDVEQYEVTAVLDSKTSAICQDFDGKIFDLKDLQIGVNAPPFHPRCRSVIVPYYDDFGIGERAARDENGKTYYVPVDMKYKEWKESFVVPKEELNFVKKEVLEKVYKVLTSVDVGKYQELSNLCYNRLTDDEKMALDYYTDDGYSYINDALKEESIYDGVINDIECIDSAMERFELPEDIVVYRGTSMDEYNDIEVGSLFPGKMYYSTSLFEYVSEDFMNARDNPVMLEIRVPKGTKSLYIGANSYVGDEAELLLSRHLKYRVLKIEPGRLFLEVEEY